MKKSFHWLFDHNARQVVDITRVPNVGNLVASITCPIGGVDCGLVNQLLLKYPLVN